MYVNIFVIRVDGGYWGAQSSQFSLRGSDFENPWLGIETGGWLMTESKNLTHWRESLRLIWYCFIWYPFHMCAIEAFLPLRCTGRPPQSRGLRFPAHTWRRWSCILLRSRRSPWRSPPGSGGWGPAADRSSWPTGPRGHRLSWRPNRSHRNPVGSEWKWGECEV